MQMCLRARNENSVGTFYSKPRVYRFDEFDEKALTYFHFACMCLHFLFDFIVILRANKMHEDDVCRRTRLVPCNGISFVEVIWPKILRRIYEKKMWNENDAIEFFFAKQPE